MIFRTGLIFASGVLLTVAGSSNAFAGDVSWQNAYYAGGLNVAYLSDSQNIIQLSSPGYTHDGWTDTKYSDGGWTEVNDASGRCLDSNYSGNVYPHSCVSGDIYQRWYEISTPTGWALGDEQTGLFLDADDTHGVYTNTNYGNSDSHQRWH